MKAYKKTEGTADFGNQLHHIVEQRNVAVFGAEKIHNTQNVIEIPKIVHQEISKYYSRIQPFSEGKTVRKWLDGQSFKQQLEFGKKVLSDLGIVTK